MEQSYKPLTKEVLCSIKVGDVVERMLAFSIPIYLIVQSVTDSIIDAGWTFCRNTGMEIDDALDDPASYIRRVLSDEQKITLKKEIEANPNYSLPYP